MDVDTDTSRLVYNECHTSQLFPFSNIRHTKSALCWLAQHISSESRTFLVCLFSFHAALLWFLCHVVCDEESTKQEKHCPHVHNDNHLEKVWKPNVGSKKPLVQCLAGNDHELGELHLRDVRTEYVLKGEAVGATKVVAVPAQRVCMWCIGYVSIIVHGIIQTKPQGCGN